MRSNAVLMHAFLAGAAGGLLTQVACADFSGRYAPTNWTFMSNGGNGSAVNDGTTLVLTGSDSGLQLPIDTDYIVTAVASGVWSFDWSFTSTDTGPFDSGGYLLNSAYTVLAFSNSQGSGSVSVPVNAGDVIGFRAWTLDDVLGPGVLTITNFSAPVPGDITGDGVVDVNDLLMVIGAWGPCPAPPATCPADIAPPPNGDGVVDVNDLLLVIANWS